MAGRVTVTLTLDALLIDITILQLPVKEDLIHLSDSTLVGQSIVTSPSDVTVASVVLPV